MRLARGKLINKERREKYLLECPELIQYWKKNIWERQRGSVNLDDHTAYLWEAQKDKSLYPHNNVMSGDRLIALLEKYGLKEKADKVQAVIKKGLKTYAPSGMLATGDPVIEPKCEALGRSLGIYTQQITFFWPAESPGYHQWQQESQ